MATSQLNGANYSLRGEDDVTFFGIQGYKYGESWVILAIEMSPDSIIDSVRGCIQRDVEAGNGDKIAMLQLTPMQAVVFYLEGRLNRELLTEVIETPDFIDIPNVDVDGRTLTVRVLRDGEDMATADSEGNIL